MTDLNEFLASVEEGSFPVRPSAISPEHLRELVAREQRERQFFRSLRALAEHRYAEGVELYGDSYMEKDLLAEAADEIADFINYLYMRAARTEREGGGRDGQDILMQACKQVIEGLETAMEYPAKRRGSP